MACLGGSHATFVKGHQVVTLVAFEYTGTKGETIRFFAGFTISPSVVSLVSLISRIFS